MIEFTLPSLGSDMDEGTLNEWLVKPGDTVTRGQVIAEVETTKSNVEVECWHDGTVYQLLAEPGSTVPVGTVLATLLEPGESAPATPPPVHATAAAAATAAASAHAHATVGVSPPPASAARPAPAAPEHHQWISPAARRQAQTRSVDLDTVTGTGPGGAITIADVDHAAQQATAAAAKPVAKPVAKSTAGDQASAMRQTIAAAMSRANREIPHYYLTETIPLNDTLEWLEQHNAERPITERVLLAVLELKAVALAARAYPDMNGFWTDGQFNPSRDIHVGVAISLRQGGLIAPALHDVADKPLDVLMTELTDLVARARAGKLRSSEMSDPTLTVTNLGDRGVEAVHGVIYPPQVALIGFGRTMTRPWIIDNQLHAAPLVVATLAADHRASDGHRGALFLAEVHNLLTHPEQL